MINESILLTVLYVCWTVGQPVIKMKIISCLFITKSKLNLIINNELNSIVILKEIDIQVLVHICKLSERGVGGR